MDKKLCIFSYNWTGGSLNKQVFRRPQLIYVVFGSGTLADYDNISWRSKSLLNIPQGI